MKRRLFAIVGGVAVAAGLTSSPAHAARPDIEHFTVQSSYTVDPAPVGPCPFPIDVNGVDKVVIQSFYNKQGVPTKVVFHDDFTGTESANGVTLPSSEHATITDDLITGTETWVGQPLRVSLPHGGSVIFDAGKLVYDAQGNIVVEHGPHPYADGDVAQYCAAFTP